MAKEKKPEANEDGEQLDLIEVQPENAKKIIAAARLYQKYQRARMKAGVKEADQKQLILELVEKADLQTLAGGKVKFEVDSLIISVEPRDKLVKVREKKKKGEPAEADNE